MTDKLTELNLKEIYDLSKKVLKFNGCNEENANAVSETVTHAERDGSISHGLFRIPGYVAALRSKKVKGCLLYTSPSPRDLSTSRMPSSA